MQVYRGLDVGTAKPDRALLAAVPHHLIDILDPSRRFDVGRFVEAAERLIDDITARGRLAVVAGGTGYYLKHLLYGLPQAPPSDPAVRERLQAELEREGLPGLRERLRAVDCSTAGRTAETDAYRTLRALEVYEQTGRPLSEFALHPGSTVAHTVVVELARARDDLSRRIHERVGRMFADGLRAEAEWLKEQSAGSEWPTRRAIGYREFFRDDGTLRPVTEDDAIRQEIETATRRYAKRQRTFANQFPDRTRLHALSHGTLEAIVRGMLSQLDSA